MFVTGVSSFYFKFCAKWWGVEFIRCKSHIQGGAEAERGSRCPFLRHVPDGPLLSPEFAINGPWKHLFLINLHLKVDS